jgi:hypothetical protein
MEHHPLTGEITGHNSIIWSYRDHHAATAHRRQRRHITLTDAAGNAQ